MICPMCNKEAYSFSNGDWYCPNCNYGVGSSRRVPIKQTTGYITNTNKDLAIECLKEVREKYKWYLSNYKSEDKIIVGKALNKINYIIDNKIKELEEGKW